MPLRAVIFDVGASLCAWLTGDSTASGKGASENSLPLCKRVLPARIREIDRIIARIQVPIERGRILQLTTYRVLLRPASEARIVVACPELVEPGAAVEVTCGILERIAGCLGS